MPNVNLYNMKGENIGTVTLAETVFGAEINASAMHSYVVAYLANQRQGTQSAKTRAEVSGGGKKPWRQKGTGRARQGSTRSPQWTHGGVVFAPKPRDYRMALNKKLKRVALVSALSSKAADEKIVVVDSIEMDTIKTAEMVKSLNALKANKPLIVLAENDEKVVKSARNIEGVEVTFVGALNTYEILKHDTLVISKGAAGKIEEVYA
ncbi:MAG: 50S ribosomal protein L4 [Clostridia bacterium]|nr:50S ribosomal protein L4 [Clostridia bacterium]MBR5714423.1 50S ribosomal protein L4 [Clostridia bacterium]